MDGWTSPPVWWMLTIWAASADGVHPEIGLSLLTLSVVTTYATLLCFARPYGSSFLSPCPDDADNHRADICVCPLSFLLMDWMNRHFKRWFPYAAAIPLELGSRLSIKVHQQPIQSMSSTPASTLEILQSPTASACLCGKCS